MGNKLPGRLKKPIVIDLDAKEYGLAALFARFMTDAEFLPALARYLQFREEQVPAIADGLRELSVAHPVAGEFVERLIKRFVPGKKILFAAKQRTDELDLGRQMAEEIDRQQSEARAASRTRRSQLDIIRSRTFKRRFRDGRGNRRSADGALSESRCEDLIQGWRRHVAKSRQSV